MESSRRRIAVRMIDYLRRNQITGAPAPLIGEEVKPLIAPAAGATIKMALF
jgi:hypothetical protein